MSQNVELDLDALEGELMEMQAEVDADMEQQPMAQPEEEPEVKPEAEEAAPEAEEAAPEAEDAAPAVEEQEPAAQEAEDAMQEEAEPEGPAAAKEPSQPAEGGKDSGKASIAIKKKPGFKPVLPKAKPPTTTASPSKPSATTSSPSKASAGAAAPTKPAPKPAAPKKKMVVARAVPAESVEEEEAAPASEAVAAEDVAEGSNKGEPKTKAKVLAAKATTVKPAATKPAAAKPAGVKKPVAGGKAKGKAKAAEDSGEAAAGSKPAAGPKKPKSAYMFFTEAKRAGIKEANPGAGFGEVGKLMGEAWKQLSNEEKQPFQALADADKERYAAECAAAGESGNKENKPADEKKARAPKAARTKTAFELFSEERRPALVANNPKASGTEIAKLLSVEYRELAEEEKAVYAAMREDLKKAEPAAAPSKKRPAKAAAGSKGKRAKQSEAESESAEEMAPAADDEEEYDNEAAHENVDYDMGPAEHIIAKSKQGKYVVARRGMPFYAYGLVDAREAKMQRLGDSSEGKPCPVSLEMIEEFEAFEKGFRRAVHDNMVDGELEYEELPDGSKLECLNILARLRQPGFPLAAKEKDDIYMKVPLLATCKAVQRLLDIERQRAQEAQQRADAAEALLAAAQGQAGGSGKAAVEHTPRTKIKTGVEV